MGKLTEAEQFAKGFFGENYDFVHSGEIETVEIAFTEGYIARSAVLESDRDALLGLLKRWLALDGGNWLVDRHARETQELRSETSAALTRSQNTPDSRGDG